MKRTPVKPPTRDEAVETSEEGKRFQNSRNSRDEEDETVNRSGGWIIVDPPSSYDNAILALKALKCIEEKKPPLLDANFSPINPEALNPDELYSIYFHSQREFFPNRKQCQKVHKRKTHLN